jgi:hypothetical protein
MLNISKISTLSKVGILLYSIAAQAMASDACAFNAPHGWNQSSTRWDGECRAGHADGLGILKEFSNRKVKRFFFGRVKDGNLDLGVIDQAEGYVAGRFAQGRLVPSGERQSFVSAFAEAEKAASQAASRFSKAGNKASARFYEAKARELREQMD